jgi:hypothetical protein
LGTSFAGAIHARQILTALVRQLAPGNIPAAGMEPDTKCLVLILGRKANEHKYAKRHIASHSWP